MRVAQSLHPLVLSFVLTPLIAAPAAAQPGSGCVLCREGAALIERFDLREMETPTRDRPGWAPPRKIVVMPPMSAWDSLLPFVQAVAPGAEVVSLTPRANLAEVVGGADVLIGICTPQILAAAPALRWVQLPFAGAESCTELPDVAGRDILVTNAQRIYGSQIAEHALALLLSLTRRLPVFHDRQRVGEWDSGLRSVSALSRMRELGGGTLLVVGLGGIGTEVARRAHALDMRVIATRNSSREGPDYVEHVGLADELHELAGQADVVVSALPLTDETVGIFDATFFRTMKPTAFFINVGRGESVVTADLVEALQSGRIAGAGLDVTDPEPLPADHPLWRIPNVIITPHVAAGTDQLVPRVATLIVENVRRYVAGDPLVSVVDLRRGY